MRSASGVPASGGWSRIGRRGRPRIIRLRRRTAVLMRRSLAARGVDQHRAGHGDVQGLHPPAIGIVTRASAAGDDLVGQPGPSPPSRTPRASAPVDGVRSWSRRAARRPPMRTPDFRIAVMAGWVVEVGDDRRRRRCPCCRAAPSSPRTARRHAERTRRWRRRLPPRSSAPTLPGSCTSMAARMNAIGAARRSPPLCGSDRRWRRCPRAASPG